MRSLLLAWLAWGIVGAAPALAAAVAQRTAAPSGVRIAHPERAADVPCSFQIRYDDGTFETPYSAPTLGWWSPVDYQNLGVVFTPPPGQNLLVQSASWFSEFWVTPGLVDVTAFQADNPSNSATTTIYVDDGGTWGVEFPNPICIPPNTDYIIMVCPQYGVWGVIGDDTDAPDGRSLYNAWSGCEPGSPWAGAPMDLMLWSCVKPCVPTGVTARTWGKLKTLYR